MNRTIVSGLVAAAMVVSALMASSSARAQQSSAGPMELNQELLDRWLVAAPALAKLGKSAAAPQTNEAAAPHVERICTEAGFQTYDQCGQVIGYVGMIVSACDRRSQTFRDPIVLMRRQLVRLQADTKMLPEARAEAIATVKEILADFPNGFPAEHIALVNANRDRIFAAIATPAQ